MPRAFLTINADTMADLRKQLNVLFSQLTVDLQRIEGFDGATSVFKGSMAHTGTSIGFFSTTPTTQASNITDSGSGDTNAQLATKINLILDVLERHGLMDTA